MAHLHAVSHRAGPLFSYAERLHRCVRNGPPNFTHSGVDLGRWEGYWCPARFSSSMIARVDPRKRLPMKEERDG